MVSCIVVIVAAVSLIVHHLALAVGHVGDSRVLHGGGVGHSPTIKRGVSLRTREFTSITLTDLYISPEMYFWRMHDTV